LKNIQAIADPNLYSYRPVLVMRFYLDDLTERESKDLLGFKRCLLELLSRLHEHVSGKGYAGGFVERLAEVRFFEHVALELTALADVPTFHGKTRQAGAPGCYNVVIEHQAQQETDFSCAPPSASWKRV
jgi:cyanophycin synthetase